MPNPMFFYLDERIQTVEIDWSLRNVSTLFSELTTAMFEDETINDLEFWVLYGKLTSRVSEANVGIDIGIDQEGKFAGLLMERLKETSVADGETDAADWWKGEADQQDH